MIALEYDYSSILDFGGINTGDAEAAIRRADKGGMVSGAQLRGLVTLLNGGGEGVGRGVGACSPCAAATGRGRPAPPCHGALLRRSGRAHRARRLRRNARAHAFPHPRSGRDDAPHPRPPPARLCPPPLPLCPPPGAQKLRKQIQTTARQSGASGALRPLLSAVAGLSPPAALVRDVGYAVGEEGEVQDAASEQVGLGRVGAAGWMGAGGNARVGSQARGPHKAPGPARMRCANHSGPSAPLIHALDRRAHPAPQPNPSTPNPAGPHHPRPRARADGARLVHPQKLPRGGFGARRARVRGGAGGDQGPGGRHARQHARRRRGVY